MVKFNSFQLLRKHVKEKHGGQVQNTSIITCDVCGSIFQKKHEIRHYDEHNICRRKLCGRKAFEGLDEMQQHMRNEHSSIQGKRKWENPEEQQRRWKKHLNDLNGAAQAMLELSKLAIKDDNTAPH